MTPYERRRLGLDHLNAQARVRGLEQAVDNCNAAIAHNKGRFRSYDQALDLAILERRRAEVISELADARVKADNLARQLAPPRSQFADQVEQEERSLAFMAALENMASGR